MYICTAMDSTKCILLLCQRNRKRAFLFQKSSLLAGAEGLEPSTKVLETHVLPLHHTPKHLFSITRPYTFVNMFQQISFYYRVGLQYILDIEKKE